jgi:hypothetical protein
MILVELRDACGANLLSGSDESGQRHVIKLSPRCCIMKGEFRPRLVFGLFINGD